MKAILENLTTAMQGITDSLGTLSGVKSDLEAFNSKLATDLRTIAAQLVALANELDPPAT